MKMAATKAIESAPRMVPAAPENTARTLGSAWTDSVWLGLAISLIVGILYALVMMGPAPLNPHNIAWMVGDPAEYYIAWELFRQDPHWHWPLTYTEPGGLSTWARTWPSWIPSPCCGVAQAAVASAAGTVSVFRT